MCGIFSLLNNCDVFPSNFINEQFMKCRKRGPENSVVKKIDINAIFGFHRLAINGLDDISNQPIIIDSIALICNGEIYNYKKLYNLLNIEPTTNSDCEIIIHLYIKYGIDYTLQLLDGVFSFVLCDSRTTTASNLNSNIYIARDPYGVRPLYVLKRRVPYNIFNDDPFANNIYGFASEIKCLTEFNNVLQDYTIEHFKPGTYSHYKLPFNISQKWSLVNEYVSYHSPGFSNNNETFQEVMGNIQFHLREAVYKRISTTERPIACLLSGGLDSSLITALVNEFSPNVETYSIGLEGSEDLKNARIVADYLNTKHTEIVLTEQEFLDAIPEVIYNIESYDTTTIRASIGNYLIGQYISTHSDAKVIFNGDGSDELCGGYLYMNYCPDPLEFDKESRRLLKDIHLFDVLRSDKCISSHGLEPRTPFLDRAWVQYYLSISPEIRFDMHKNQEKYLLRSAFSEVYYINNAGTPLLPPEILWRKKEAFSDGVSMSSRSLYQIIQEYIDSEKMDEINEYRGNKYTHNKPDTNEKLYYRSLFDTYYPKVDNIIPYFWMPKYVVAKDPSARTIQVEAELEVCDFVE